jgi:hypothetical protein
MLNFNTEQSRRDDLESLMYNLLFLAKGHFPWFSSNRSKPSAKTETILQMKKTLSTEELFRGLPSTEHLLILIYYRGISSGI